MHRGGQNRAREKVWPGAGAAIVRKLKREQSAIDLVATRQKTAEKLDAVADEIFKRSGDYSLTLEAQGLTQGKIFNAGVYGRVPSVEKPLYQPVVDTQIETAKTIHKTVCPTCNGPKSKWSSSHSECRICYHNRSKKRFAARVVEKHNRVDAWIEDKYVVNEFLLEPWFWDNDIIKVQRRHTENMRIRCTDDFAPFLIDAITDVEIKVGIPVCFWAGRIDFEPLTTERAR